MKKAVRYAVGVAVLTACMAAAGFAGYAFGTIGTRFESSLAYTEQIDYLLKIVVFRLAREDSPATLSADLRHLSANYRTSYEGQPFWELMERYLERDVTRPRLCHQQRPHYPLGRQIEPTDANADQWTLPGAVERDE